MGVPVRTAIMAVVSAALLAIALAPPQAMAAAPAAVSKSEGGHHSTGGARHQGHHVDRRDFMPVNRTAHAEYDAISLNTAPADDGEAEMARELRALRPRLVAPGRPGLMGASEVLPTYGVDYERITETGQLTRFYYRAQPVHGFLILDDLPLVGEAACTWQYATAADATSGDLNVTSAGFFTVSMSLEAGGGADVHIRNGTIIAPSPDGPVSEPHCQVPSALQSAGSILDDLTSPTLRVIGEPALRRSADGASMTYVFNATEAKMSEAFAHAVIHFYRGDASELLESHAVHRMAELTGTTVTDADEMRSRKRALLAGDDLSEAGIHEWRWSSPRTSKRAWLERQAAERTAEEHETGRELNFLSYQDYAQKEWGFNRYADIDDLNLGTLIEMECTGTCRMSADLDVEFYMETGSNSLLDYVSLDINGEVSMLLETDIVFTAAASYSYQKKTAFGPLKLSLASAGLSLLGFQLGPYVHMALDYKADVFASARVALQDVTLSDGLYLNAWAEFDDYFEYDATMTRGDARVTTPSISAQARFDLDLHLIPTVGLGIGAGGTMLAAGGSALAQLRADYDISFHVEAQYDSSSDSLAPLSQSDYISDLGSSCLNWHCSEAKFGIEGHGVTLFFEYEWTYWYSTGWDTYTYSDEDSYYYDVDYTGFDRFGVAAFCGVCGAPVALDVGDSCSSSSQCPGLSYCRDGRCCGENNNGYYCTACDSYGDCTDCDPGYVNDRSGGSGNWMCVEPSKKKIKKLCKKAKKSKKKCKKKKNGAKNFCKFKKGKCKPRGK